MQTLWPTRKPHTLMPLRSTTRQVAPLRIASLYPLFLCAVLALATLSVRSWAQLSTSGTINGAVTDATGAVVPGAAVAVVNQLTKQETHTVSNGNGGFAVPGLQPGPYDITISKEGFESFKEAGVVLSPAQVVSINAALTAGAVTTTVNVQAPGQQVETSTPEVSSQVTSQQVGTLPLNGRNYQGLAFLMPGVTNLTPDTALLPGGFLTSNNISVNGMGQSGTMYYLDGIWNENTGNMTQTTITPNPDTIEEVRLLQNNYGAEYTLNGPNVMLLQTKSGTSSFHGSAFEYLRNTDLNARNYFSPTVPALEQNIFGYTIGGPIFIPGHYNKDKKKTFFFWSQQWTIQHVANVVLGTDPTAAERNGTFADGVHGFTGSLIDPLTGQPFPQTSPGVYQIPAARLNSNSLALLSAIAPLPNNTANGFLNYINLTPTINNTRDDQIKVDHEISSRLRLMAEYLDDRQTNHNATDTFISSPFSTTQEPITTANQLAQVRLTQIISPQMVNTTSVSMNNYVVSLNLTGLVNSSQVPGFQPVLPYAGLLSERLPEINFNSGWSTLGVSYQLPLNHASDLEDSIADDWSWLRGKHYIQAGVTEVWGTKRQNDFAATAGEWLFSGQFTNNPMADFLIGDGATFNQQSNEIRAHEFYKIFSPYIQDQWKLTPRLTVTAGLRYLFAPLPNFAVPLSNFDPAVYNPADAPIVNPSGTITATPNYNPANGIVIGGVTKGTPQNLSSKHQNFFNPVVGFAYNVFGDGKTSLRGGFGITHQNYFAFVCTSQCQNNYPLTTTINLVTPSFPDPTGAAAAPATIETLSGAVATNITQPQIRTYSLNLEQQLKGGWILAITGAGNSVIHGIGGPNVNTPLPEGGYDFNPIINTGTVSPYAYGEPYAGWGAMTTYNSLYTASWNALEVNARHPVGHNLFLSVAYTWQKGLSDQRGNGGVAGNGGAIQDVYNRRASWGPTNTTPPQIFALSALWAIPYFSNGKGLEHWVLGNWQYSDITSIQSGFPLDPALSTATPGLATLPDRVPGQAIRGPKTKDEWFNTNAFAAPPPGFYGNAETGSIPGPGVINFDMALYKTFKIGEHSGFQFRSEFFNIFNHTNFSSVSTGVGSGNYGQVTSALDPRILELALRFDF